MGWFRELVRRLQIVTGKQLNGKRDRFLAAASLLEAVSPLAVLGRGYAVVRSGRKDKRPGELIRSTAQAAVGRQLEIILQKGKIGAQVDEIIEDGRDERI